jgi:hypothetical protein
MLALPPGAAPWEAFHVLAKLGITDVLGEAKINRVECVSLLNTSDVPIVLSRLKVSKWQLIQTLLGQIRLQLEDFTV